jgi:hypothetical protein
MPRRPLHVALLLLLPGTTAADDPRFEALRRTAEPVESLAGFVERYVGLCKDPAQRLACEENVKAARRALHGRLHAALLAERARDLIRVERRGRAFRFLVTPFIDADGLALTHGQPRLDGRGRPSIGFIVLDAPPGVDEAMVDAALRTGRVEMEILFRAEGAWKLRRKDEPGYYEGVLGRFAAIRLVDGRTGAEIAVKVL